MKRDPQVVLCVDDDSDVLASLQLTLEANGYQYVGASSAEEALDACANAMPDLVITDLMMEELNAGVTLARELASRPDAPPVYLLSSQGNAMARSADCHELGFAGVLHKPLSPTALLALLRGRLG